MADYFFLKADGGGVKIFFNDILYIEAFDKYVKFVTVKKIYTVYDCLHHVEKTLPFDFCRIHRSYVISLRHITKFSADLISIADKELPIGKQYRSSFASKIQMINAGENPKPVPPDKDPAFATERAKHTLVILIAEDLFTK